MKFVFLALSTLISTSAFATSDSLIKFYYPYSAQEGMCMGTHLFMDRIGTSMEAGIMATIDAVKSPVRIGSRGGTNDLIQENNNYIYAGPNVELYKLASYTEKEQGSYTTYNVVIDFGWMGKYNEEMYNKFVPLSYYALVKSLQPLSSYNSLIMIKIINSPVAKLGNIILSEEQPISAYLSDRLKLELQKADILGLDAGCR